MCKTNVITTTPQQQDTNIALKCYTNPDFQMDEICTTDDVHRMNPWKERIRYLNDHQKSNTLSDRVSN